jgi:MinD-like ATPase involved in chromosome partitioning or flagellar assembly
MTVGFVVSQENWAIIEPGLEETIDVAFVSHEPHFPTDDIHHHSPAFLVVEALPHFLTTEMVAACDREGIVLAALITHSTGEQLGIERGVGHVIRQPGDLIALLSGDSAFRPATPASDRGIVVAVWGATGSPGRTTIALALAGAVRARGIRVIAIDADPRGGTIATEWGLLDEVPGFLALCRTASKGILDPSQVRRLVLHCDSRAGVIDVLTGLPRVLREGEIARDSISEVFSQLRQMYPITIVDAGSDLPDSSTHHPGPTPAKQLTGHVIGAADHLVAVIGAQPSGVARFARVHDDLRATMDYHHRDYVLNGIDSSRRALGDEAVVRSQLFL